MLFIKAGLDNLRVLIKVILYLFKKLSMYSLVEISNTWDNKKQSEFSSFNKYHSRFESINISIGNWLV